MASGSIAQNLVYNVYILTGAVEKVYSEKADIKKPESRQNL